MFQEHVEFAKAIVAAHRVENEYSDYSCVDICIFCREDQPAISAAVEVHKVDCVVTKAHRVIRISNLPADEYTGHKRHDPYYPHRTTGVHETAFKVEGVVHADSASNESENA